MIVADDQIRSMGAHRFAQHMARVERRAIRSASLQKDGLNQPEVGIQAEKVEFFQTFADKARSQKGSCAFGGIQARGFPERFATRVSRQGGNQAKKERVSRAQPELFEDIAIGFKDGCGRKEALAQNSAKAFAFSGMKCFQCFFQARKHILCALFRFLKAHPSNAPASCSAWSTSAGSSTGSARK